MTAPGRGSARPPSTSSGQLRRGRSRADGRRERARPRQRGRPARGRGPQPARALPCTATSTSCPRTPPTGRWTRSRGELRDGCVWGRGAVDMKDMDAMILAVVRHLARTRHQAAARPRRSRSSPTRRPGGARQPLGRRPPPGALRGRRRGDQRGRRLQRDRAVRRRWGAHAGLPAADRREGHRLAAAARARPGGPRLRAQRRQRHRAAGRRRRRGSARTRGRASTSPPSASSSTGSASSPGVATPTRTPSALLAHLGGRPGLRPRHPAGHRQLHHGSTRGYKHNVIPQSATAALDCRFLPGHEDDAHGHHPRAGRRARRGRGRAPRHRPRRAVRRRPRRRDEGCPAGGGPRAPRCCPTASPVAPTTRP